MPGTLVHRSLDPTGARTVTAALSRTSDRYAWTTTAGLVQLPGVHDPCGGLAGEFRLLGLHSTAWRLRHLTTSPPDDSHHTATFPA
ncbi:hypothetical protein [Streptomyces cellulosae]|uniref:Uncharacterized protein n=1 Tax=Streptomyces cellulosae TaxID=1968 RepID=A0ABW7XXI2_STRCE